MKKRISLFFLASIIGAMLLGGCGEKAGQPVAASPVAEQSKDDQANEEMSEPPKESIAPQETAEPVVEAEPEPEEPNYDIIPESFAYSLTVSINPLVELYFDSDNTVVGVSYLNEDAVDAYREVELVGSSISEGLDLLVNAAADKGYLKEDATVEIELAKISEEAEETFDSGILIDASQVVNEVLETISEEKEIALEATVEIKVNTEVEEKVGVKAPVICSDCNGTGNNCKECNGTAIVNCKRCSGGWETCGICNGTGHEICHGCKGTGIDDMGGTCNRCGGAGHSSTCVGCGGAGGFNCSWCKGALKHICPECWGEGTCSTCGGDGIM